MASIRYIDFFLFRCVKYFFQITETMEPYLDVSSEDKKKVILERDIFFKNFFRFKIKLFF
jgi:hypothetical protein